MIFAKLDVCMPTHPKFIAAGPAATGYWAAALAYVRGHDLDGLLPDKALGVLLGVGAAEGRELADRLVSVGLFQRVRGGYFIFNYASKNETKAQVETRRAATRERVAKSRRHSAANGSAHGVTEKNVTPDVTLASNTNVTAPSSVVVPGSDSDSDLDPDLPRESQESGLRAVGPPMASDSERYVRLADALDGPMREIAAFPGSEVRDVESVWRAFTGHYADQWVNVPGKWQKWCAVEVQKQRSKREGERDRDAVRAAETRAAADEQATELRRRQRERDRADGDYQRTAVPPPVGDLLKAIGGKKP